MLTGPQHQHGSPDGSPPRNGPRPIPETDDNPAAAFAAPAAASLAAPAAAAFAAPVAAPPPELIMTPNGTHPASDPSPSRLASVAPSAARPAGPSAAPRVPTASASPVLARPPERPLNEPASRSPASAEPGSPTTQTPQPARTPPATPKFVVLRGLRIGTEYPIYEGRNTIGRFAERPVDIDLSNQETVEQIWCSRQHAVVTYDKGIAVLEDLNSLNGTWVNGSRLPPGQRRQLQANDIVQIGTVQLKFVLG
jgi:pSer/pThr/pTyr-binding forkhead associated (FHA) protein